LKKEGGEKKRNSEKYNGGDERMKGEKLDSPSLSNKGISEREVTNPTRLPGTW
jgi:hypothetical protein